MKRLSRIIIALLIITAISSFMVLPASAANNIAYGAATVSADLLNIRSGAGTKYSVLKVIGENDIVVILDKVNDEWFHINYNGIVGYAAAQYFTNVLTAENFSATGTVKGNEVFMREKPATNAKVINSYNNGALMSIVGINEGFYKVKYDGNIGYIRSDYIEISSGYTKNVNIADSQPPKSQAPTTVTVNNSPSKTTHADTGNAIVDFALDYLGYNYKYGAMSPSTGFDCSGFTSYVYKNFGITLTRNASGQYRDNGYSVNKSDMIPGDLVFFSSNGGQSVTHVGIYMGDNEFVHASTERTGVVVSRLDSTYYLRVWYGAKRVTG